MTWEIMTCSVLLQLALHSSSGTITWVCKVKKSQDLTHCERRPADSCNMLSPLNCEATFTTGWCSLVATHSITSLNRLRILPQWGPGYQNLYIHTIVFNTSMVPRMLLHPPRFALCKPPCFSSCWKYLSVTCSFNLRLFIPFYEALLASWLASNGISHPNDYINADSEDF